MPVKKNKPLNEIFKQIKMLKRSHEEHPESWSCVDQKNLTRLTNEFNMRRKQGETVIQPIPRQPTTKTPAFATGTVRSIWALPKKEA